MAGKQVNPYKTHWYQRRLAYLFRKDRDRPDGVRDVPEVVHLDVEKGIKANKKPVVRIYLGTEPAQHRAERVFVWSVMKVRDPARKYEIHLMSDIKGVDRTGWKTGFTNYRYAIPDFAGNKGKAIYNDVDQIYLGDPAELFDMEMGGAGVAAISVKENSVMLIDCKKMTDLWRMDDVKAGHKHDHFKNAMNEAGLFTEMAGVWNCRDGEWPIKDTKCLHYTTLHTQPWQPFPDQLRYAPSRFGHVWQGLEDEADAAGYSVFTKSNPSRRFGELIEQYKKMHTPDSSDNKSDVGTFHGVRLPKSSKIIARLIAETSAKTILDYGSGKGVSYTPYPGEPEGSRFKSNKKWGDVMIVCYDPGHEPFSKPYTEKTDGVISTDVVEHIPSDDIPWVLDEIFSQASRFVYVLAANYLAKAILPNGENAHCTIHDSYWWESQMKRAARKYPEVRWVLGLDSKRAIGGKKIRSYAFSDSR